MKLNYRFNLLLLLSLFLFVFFCFKIIDLSLKKYTLHDDIIIVPSLIGLSLENIEDTLNYYDLNLPILHHLILEILLQLIHMRIFIILIYLLSMELV